MDYRDRILGGLHAPLDPNRSDHRDMLVEKLKSFKSNSEKRITFEYLADEIQKHYESEIGGKTAVLISDSWLRKFTTKSENMTPSKQKLNLIYRYLDANGGWDQRTAAIKEVSAIKDALYFGLHSSLDIPEKTTTNLVRRLPGLYRIYRPVLTHPEHYTIGAVWIHADNDRGVIKYEEQQTIQKLNGREGKKQRLEGYAFKKSNFISLFGTDTGKNNLHLTTFTSCQVQDDMYNVLFGGFFDTLGSQMFSGQVFMERIQNLPVNKVNFENLASEACCLSEQQVPPSALVYFENTKRSGDMSLF